MSSQSSDECLMLNTTSNVYHHRLYIFINEICHKLKKKPFRWKIASRKFSISSYGKWKAFVNVCVGMEWTLFITARTTKISEHNFLFHSQYSIEMCDKAIKIKSKKLLGNFIPACARMGAILWKLVIVMLVWNGFVTPSLFLSFPCTFLAYMFRVQGYIYCINTCDIDFFVAGYVHMVWSPHG